MQIHKANNRLPNISILSCFTLLVLTLFNFVVSATDLRTEAPEGASVYFIGLQDGDTVSSPVLVRFGLSAMGVAPAGVEKEHTGHHHLLVNLDEMPNMEMPLPSTENVVHFGKGQTETSLDLTTGTHTLQLLLGNHFHVPHNPPVMSEKITITVD
ncbi:MAG: DUF4399 domain-containing protein [Acidiferrobacterales bacterium]|nr:DUF4399 domain-containing protein [Acidiferrobacterales bacterium]